MQYGIFRSPVYSPVQLSPSDVGEITCINFWLYHLHHCMSTCHSEWCV